MSLLLATAKGFNGTIRLQGPAGSVFVAISPSLRVAAYSRLPA
ncbi:hypothetical protein [Streptomyces sp. NPDC047985]